MKNFGTGPTLREVSPTLRDDAERRARIIDVTERNSVIEGLQPLQAETRWRLLEQLSAMSPAGKVDATYKKLARPSERRYYLAASPVFMVD
jgi:hypothetical protein